MAYKSVMVSYNGRNKPVRIPNSLNETHVQYLDKECRRMFGFSSMQPMNVTFQKYDSEWEMEVDLDNFYIASNKDKLKLLVTPLLSAATGQISLSVSLPS